MARTAAATALAAALAAGWTPAPAANFDFDYSVTGTPALTPLQVFDDGNRTYIQFPNPGRMPAVAVTGPRGEVIAFDVMPPYVVLNRVAPRFTLRNGSQAVEVASNHAPAAPAATRPTETARAGSAGALMREPQTIAAMTPDAQPAGDASPVVSVMTADQNAQTPDRATRHLVESGAMPAAMPTPAPAPRDSANNAALDAANDAGAAPLTPSVTPVDTPAPTLPVIEENAASPAPILAAAAPSAAPAPGSGYILSPGPLKTAFATLAEKYGYSLNWQVKENRDQYVFDYPITLLGKSFIDDVKALERSVNQERRLFVIDVYEANRVISVKGNEQ